MSPSDIVGPSPVTSNGTETTEIEDDVSEDLEKEVSDRKSTRRSEVSLEHKWSMHSSEMSTDSVSAFNAHYKLA
jgi:hypothetical protein